MIRPVVTETTWRLISEFSTSQGKLQSDMAAFGPFDANPLRLGLDGDETPTRDRIAYALVDLEESRNAVAISLATAYGRIDRYADGDRDIDAVTARLIAHMGMEPLMVAWLAALCGGIHIGNHDGDPLVDVDIEFKPHETREQNTEIHIGENITWKACGTVVAYGMPDAIALAAEGRPLSTIVSHPALDAFNLTVARVELAHDRHSGAELQCDFEHTYPTVEELAAMEPKR